MTCDQKGKWPGVPLSRPSVAGRPKQALLSDFQGYCARSQDRTRHVASSFRIPIRATILVAATESQLEGGDAHRANRNSVVVGKSVSVQVDLGGRRDIKISHSSIDYTYELNYDINVSM